MDTDDLPFSTQETSSTSPMRLEYAMNNKRRGKAVIINNKKFDYKKTRRTERKHSDVDAASLYTVFKSRGFDVKLCNDQTVAGMKKLFQECKYFPKQYLFVGEYLPWDFVIWLFVPWIPVSFVWALSPTHFCYWAQYIYNARLLARIVHKKLTGRHMRKRLCRLTIRK